IVDTPGVKVYIGRTPKESVEYGGLTLTLEQSRLRWGAVSITAAEPPSGGSGDVLAPGRYLIAATGDVRNTGAKYVSPEPDQITTAADYGGADGEAPILCEGLGAVIHLSKISAENVLLYPLDGSGNRTAEIPADEDADGCSVRLDARHKTIWYELVIR
ncbi:MAG: hypothetical protein IIZ25_04350, partial [Thermoguttaceae bacterium]|nr:hypothetical protein [Thermoguttaceae bacterium]